MKGVSCVCHFFVVLVQHQIEEHEKISSFSSYLLFRLSVCGHDSSVLLFSGNAECGALSAPTSADYRDALLKEGFEYGRSRVIAGFHWQSDVDAARVVAGAAFARLHTGKTYLKQLKKAQKEFVRKKKNLKK